MTNFDTLTKQAVAEIRATVKTTMPTRDPDETSLDRHVAKCITNAQAQVAAADEVIAEHLSLAYDELYDLLAAGNMTLNYSVRAKAKAEKLIAKYSDPEWMVERKAAIKIRDEAWKLKQQANR